MMKKKVTYVLEEKIIEALKEIKALERRSVNTLVSLALESFINSYLKRNKK